MKLFKGRKWRYKAIQRGNISINLSKGENIVETQLFKEKKNELKLFKKNK